MTASSDVLVPIKFITIMSQLITASIIFYSKDQNIINYVDTSLIVKAEASLTAGVTLTVILNSLEILIMMSGLTLYFDRVNLVQSILHFIGTVLYIWFIIESWKYDIIWILWGLFCLAPLLLEILCFAGVKLFYQGLIIQMRKKH